MVDLVAVGVAGFVAAMVDGALGMGFGPTSSTILLSSGLSPAATSMTVNVAKMATGVATAGSHWRLGNVDRQLVRALVAPGVIGAVVGATVLARVDGEDLRPLLAVLLAVVGVRVLLRFSRPLPPPPSRSRTDGVERAVTFDPVGVRAVGAVGGCTNGLVGAWGPVVTPFLLQRGVPPRFAVGSVNTAEVAVAVVATGSLLATGVGTVELAVVLAMLGGGVLAAPLAAHAVRVVPARAMGLAVAALLLLTQARELAGAAGLGPARWALYAAAVSAIALAALRPRLAGRTATQSVGSGIR